MKFKDKLKMLREKNNMSQKDLAEKLGVTEGTISDWELGQVKPDMDNLIDIGKIFDISIDKLIIEEEGTEKRKRRSHSKEKDRNWVKIIATLLVVLVMIAVIVKFCFTVISFNELIEKEEDKSMGGAKNRISVFFELFFDFSGKETKKMKGNKEKSNSEKYQEFIDLIKDGNDDGINSDNETIKKFREKYQEDTAKQEIKD